MKACRSGNLRYRSKKKKRRKKIRGKRKEEKRGIRS